MLGESGTAGFAGYGRRPTPRVQYDGERRRLSQRLTELETHLRALDVPSDWRAGLEIDRDSIAGVLTANAPRKTLYYPMPQPWPALDVWRAGKRKGTVHEANLSISVCWVIRVLLGDVADIEQRAPLGRLLEVYEKALNQVLSKTEQSRTGGTSGGGTAKRPHTEFLRWWRSAAPAEGVIDMLEKEWEQTRDAFERDTRKRSGIADVRVRRDAEAVTFEYDPELTEHRPPKTLPFKEIYRIVRRAGTK